MLLALSDGCCPRIDNYQDGSKLPGSYVILAEKVNGNCHYMLQGDNVPPFGIWMCGDSWWIGVLSDKGECKGILQASTDSKPNVHVQDNSLQWKHVSSGDNRDLNFNCVDLCL